MRQLVRNVRDAWRTRSLRISLVLVVLSVAVIVYGAIREIWLPVFYYVLFVLGECFEIARQLRDQRSTGAPTAMGIRRARFAATAFALVLAPALVWAVIVGAGLAAVALGGIFLMSCLALLQLREQQPGAPAPGLDDLADRWLDRFQEAVRRQRSNGRQ